jgi:hypothetical protein
MTQQDLNANGSVKNSRIFESTKKIQDIPSYFYDDKKKSGKRRMNME